MSKLCIICCYSYKFEASTSVEDNQDDAVLLLKRSQQIKEFCHELERDLLFDQLIDTLEQDSSKKELAICSECVGCIEQTVERKKKMEEKEVQVWQLQSQLIVMMKELEQLVDQFYLGMERIEEIVRESDVSCLQLRLEKRAGWGDEAIRKTRASSVNAQEKGMNGVLLFRNRITEVATRMGGFRHSLRERFSCSSEIAHEPCIMSGTGLSTKGVRLDLVKQETSEELLPPLSPQHPMEWCEIDLQEEEDVDKEFLPELADAADDACSNYSEEERRPSPVMKKTKKQKKKKSIKKDLISSTGCPKSKQRDELNNFDTSSWSEFKKTYVTRLIRRSKRKKQSLEKDETLLKQHYMDYDPSTDELSVGSVKVLLVEDSEPSTNKRIKCLKCSLCDHQVNSFTTTENIITAYNNMERNMVVHVLGHHLDAFVCPYCSKRLLSYWRYSEHVKGHQGYFTCDICGKSCSTKDTLQYHKWGHMSQEEQEEALRNGARNPKKYAELEREKPSNGHVCPTCGKGFKNPRLLKQHEEIHQENREITVCPKCGKTMLKHSYLVYHKSHGCSVHDELQPHRVHCLKCNVSFKSKQFLNRHMIRVHSKEGMERPHVCPVCSKRFKAKSDLTFHSQIHAEDKLFKCGKGCGKEFSVKRYWKRHELVCTAAGSVVRESVEEIKVDSGELMAMVTKHDEGMHQEIVVEYGT